MLILISASPYFPLEDSDHLQGGRSFIHERYGPLLSSQDGTIYTLGLRDPYELTGEGAGFVLSWQGHTKLLIGHPNSNNEVVQVISDSMIIAVPR